MGIEALKRLIWILPFMVSALGLAGQAVVIDGSRVLVEQDDGVFVPVQPEPIYLHDSVNLGMTLTEFQRLPINVSETGVFTYVHSDTLVGMNTTVTLGFDVMDTAADGPGAQLTSLTYTFDDEVTEDLFNELVQLVEHRLDGVPLRAEIVIPEQSVPFDYDGSLRVELADLEYSVRFSADCGAFTVSLVYNNGRVVLEYSSYEYLLDRYIEMSRRNR